MIEQTLGKKYSQFVNILIFIFPIVINSVKVAGDIVLFILAMMGIFIAFLQKISPFIIKEIKVIYLTKGSLELNIAAECRSNNSRISHY
jgi:hypothetical protein